MTASSPDYFRYFPTTPENERWGAVLSASGLTRILPNSPYPPVQHPEDHQLDWKHGRIIDALQLILVSDGGGWLETRETRRKRVEAGMAFLIMPNIWHRYRPDPATGWVESWVELRGHTVRDLLESRPFSAANILRRGAIESGLEETLNRIHRRVLGDATGNLPELSMIAMQALARFSHLDAGAPRLSNIQNAIMRAERHLNENYRQAVNVEDLAKLLGVAYSPFRRAFRLHTGFSPWQYVIRLRLSRARALMASADATLDDIATRVGFSSGFHLSASFKQVYGVAPTPWRRGLAQDGIQGKTG